MVDSCDTNRKAEDRWCEVVRFDLPIFKDIVETDGHEFEFPTYHFCRRSTGLRGTEGKRLRDGQPEGAGSQNRGSGPRRISYLGNVRFGCLIDMASALALPVNRGGVNLWST